MTLEVDNKGAVDICKTPIWTVEGRTRHVEVKMYYFLRELK